MKVDVVVETPRGSRNKYEWDPGANRMRLDRRVPGAVSFPVDYGYIPDTTASDGDPLDVLLLLQESTFPGVVVEARPVGVCWICDSGDREPKIVCVSTTDPTYSSIKDLAGVPSHILDEIEQFFDCYKDLEPGKFSRFDGFEDADAARRVIRDCKQ